MKNYRLSLVRLLLIATLFTCSADSFCKVYKIAAPGISLISTIDAEGKGTGFFNDVVKHILEKNGHTSEFVSCTWLTCSEMLRNGEVDVFPGLIKNANRSLEFDFSRSNLYNVWGEILSYNENSITNLRMLEGKRVGVLKGVFLNETFGDVLAVYNITVDIISFDTVEGLFSSLELRNTDAIITNNVFMLGVADNYSYYHTGIVFSPTSFRLATKKGANPNLIALLDNGLHQLKRDHTSIYYTLRNQYMARSLSGRISSLFWPIFSIVVLGLIVFGLYLFAYTRNLLPFGKSALLRKEKLVLSSNNIRSVEWRSGWTNLRIDSADDALNSLFSSTSRSLNGLIHLIHPEDREVIHKSLESIFKLKSSHQNIEFRVLIEDISRWVGLQGSVIEFDSQGRPVHILGVIQDITDKKMLYIHQKQALQQYQTIFETSNIGFWHWNIPDEKMAVNGPYSTMLGYTVDERNLFISSKFVQSQIHSDDQEKFRRGLNSHLEGQTSIFDTEYRMKKEDDTYVWIHSKGVILERSGTGLPTSMVGINTNIDGNKMNEIAILERERQLSELAMKLEENMVEAQSANRLKSSFLANMSHEIRTPLNAVIGMTDVLSETDLDENQQYYVDIVSQAGDNLLALINDILDTSKIEAGELKVESKEFAIREVASRAVELVAFRFKDKDIIFSYEINGDVPRKIMGDEYRLYQVLVNLLNNAGKFTEKGEVCLRLGRGIVGESEVLKFEVIDTGRGIPKDSLDVIFNVFGQVTSDSLPKIEGTGLGLTISRQLVLMMGGDIGVDSEEGVGSNFYFTIALKSIESFTPNLEVLARLNGKKISLCNNHKIENNIVVDHFERYGCVVMQHYEFDDINFEKIDALMLDWRSYVDQNLEEHIIKLSKKHKDKIIMLQPVFYGNDQLNQIHNAGLRNYLHRPLQMEKIDDILLNRHTITGTGVDVLNELSSSINFKKLLIVDDSDANLELMKVYVSGVCDHFDCAQNGAEAVDAVKNNDYDLVFMDIQMPIMDGHQAISKIREHEKENNLDKTTVIALTAYALKDEVDKINESGFDDYLAKPLKKKVLLSCIKKYNKAT